jgi:hypothetical protein
MKSDKTFRKFEEAIRGYTKKRTPANRKRLVDAFDVQQAAALTDFMEALNSQECDPLVAVLKSVNKQLE